MSGSRFRWEPGDLRWAMYLSIDEAPVLRGILLDFCDVMEDEPTETDRVALARRLAEDLRDEG